MTPAIESDRTVRFLGNNEIEVLVSSDETTGAYCILAMTIQPRGGATALHTDEWIETFQVIDGQIEWTLERDGKLVTWMANPGKGSSYQWARNTNSLALATRRHTCSLSDLASSSSSSARWRRRGKARTTANGRLAR